MTPQPLHATQTAVPPQVANATRARKRRVLTAAAVTLTSCAAAGVV